MSINKNTPPSDKVVAIEDAEFLLQAVASGKINIVVITDDEWDLEAAMINLLSHAKAQGQRIVELENMLSLKEGDVPQMLKERTSELKAANQRIAEPQQ